MAVPDFDHSIHAAGVIAVPAQGIPVDIPDYKSSAGAKNPAQFTQRRAGIIQILEHLNRGGLVKLGVLERHVISQTLYEVNSIKPRTTIAGRIEHIRAGIKAGDLTIRSHGTGQFCRQKPVAAAEIKDPVAGFRRKGIETDTSTAGNVCAKVCVIQQTRDVFVELQHVCPQSVHISGFSIFRKGNRVLPLAPGKRFAYKSADIAFCEAAMTGEMSPIDKAKYVAAVRAADMVQDGMRVGLGTGSTAAWLVRRLGERVKEEGLRIRGVPTSTRTAELAQEVGIEVVSLDQVGWLDLTIDGADEFDGDLNLIKGGGGAHLQEKVVATASDEMVVIADAGKEVETLGAFPLPVEVIPFGWQTSRMLIEEMLDSMDVLGTSAALRMDGDAPFVTDEGNHILDLHLQRIGNARQLALVLNQVPGVVENGLFIDICDKVVIGHGDGRVEVRDINEGTIELDRLAVAESDNMFSDLAD